MKNFKFLTFAFFALMSLSTVVYMNSCKTDPCKDVVCQNGGTCVDGTCSCLTGYEGTNCETELRSKFLVAGASFTETGTTYSSFTSATTNGTNTYNMTISKGATVDVIMIENVGNYSCSSGTYSVAAKMNSSTTFTIAQTTVCGTTFTGSGSINNGKVTVNYVATYADPVNTGKTYTDTFSAVQN
jgi:hypothetical protein